MSSNRKPRGRIEVSRRADVRACSRAGDHGEGDAWPRSTIRLCFRVARSTRASRKFETAIEGLFKVKVKAVNTLRTNGKIKRFRGTIGRRPETKKAVVTLEEGQSIDVTTGV